MHQCFNFRSDSSEFILSSSFNILVLYQAHVMIIDNQFYEKQNPLSLQDVNDFVIILKEVLVYPAINLLSLERFIKM